MSSEDDGYVHRPGAARDDDAEPAEDGAETATANSGTVDSADDAAKTATANSGTVDSADDAAETATANSGTVDSADDANDADAVGSSDGVAPNAGSAGGAQPEAVDRSMGWRGWVLIATLAFSLLVAPAVILWRPPGLPYWAALLALPMLPAILLGAVAVWATTRP